MIDFYFAPINSKSKKEFSLGYKYYRDSLIQLGIVSICLPFQFYESIVTGKSVDDPKLIVFMMALAIIALAFLTYKTMTAKRLEKDITNISQELATSKRKREKERKYVLGFALFGSVLIIFLGLHETTIGFIPAHYLGLLLLGYCILGLCGVNIWVGGPLDPQHDPPQ